MKLSYTLPTSVTFKHLAEYKSKKENKLIKALLNSECH